MKRKETWNSFSKGQKILILLRDLPLCLVLLSVLAGLIWEFDNSVLGLICLPVSALSQMGLSWKRDRKTALFFLFAAFFISALLLVALFLFAALGLALFAFAVLCLVATASQQHGCACYDNEYTFHDVCN